jgi:hypothetical protein
VIAAGPFVLQLARVGMLLGLLGGVTLAYGGGRMVLANRSYHGPSDADHRREKMAYLVAGFLFGTAFLVNLVVSFLR